MDTDVTHPYIRIKRKDYDFLEALRREIGKEGRPAFWHEVISYLIQEVERNKPQAKIDERKETGG